MNGYEKITNQDRNSESFDRIASARLITVDDILPSRSRKTTSIAIALAQWSYDNA